ncbi:putative Serum response factor [Balamuthia mandrillaris]
MDLLQRPSHVITDVTDDTLQDPLIERILQRAFVLSEISGSEVLALVYVRGSLRCFASRKLKPMLDDKGGRTMIGTLLVKKEESQEDKDKDVEQTTTTEQKKEGEEKEPELSAEEREKFEKHREKLLEGFEEEDLEKVSFILQPDQREKEFKARLAALMQKLRDISVQSSLPDALYKAEVLLLVATPSHQVATMATPKLKPIITTEQGKKLITTLLNSSI